MEISSESDRDVAAAGPLGTSGRVTGIGKIIVVLSYGFRVCSARVCGGSDRAEQAIRILVKRRLQVGGPDNLNIRVEGIYCSFSRSRRSYRRAALQLRLGVGKLEAPAELPLHL